MIKPYYEEPGIQIFCADCRDVLPQLEPVDLVLTDPPYSEQTHDGALTNRSDGIQKLVDFDSISIEELKCIYGMISNISRAWVISFMDYSHVVEMEHNPPKLLRSIRFGVWVKNNPIPQLSGDRPAQGFEAISILHHKGGKMKWNGGGKPAVWFDNVGTNNLHPTGKPIKIVREIVGLFSKRGDTVLDPFMGSGTTLRAAKDLGRKAIGIEIEQKYCDIAIERLRQGVLL